MEKQTIILGLGATGVSIARYLQRQQQTFSVCDTRDNPPDLLSFKQEFPSIDVICGPLQENKLKQAAQIIISPGVALSTPAVQAAIVAGVEVIGDVELFSRVADKPILAITGSNGKTTVTTMVGEITAAAGYKVGVGGNIGTPCLDLLQQDYDLYVLELSSFQLETCPSLKATAAVCLNITEDHMDRYPDFAAYAAAKHNIYRGCQTAVINCDDPVAWQGALLPKNVIKISLSTDTDDALTPQNTLQALNINDYFAYQLLNMLAAFALCQAIGIDAQIILNTLQNFKDLAHRCQLVANRAAISWINDSKATNVGSAVAAIEGIGAKVDGKIILIAGGDGKEANFSPLSKPIEQNCKAVILIGKDKAKIAAIIPKTISVYPVDDLPAAVQLAKDLAQKGDAVLLSPACASLDMFKNYIQRGEQFCQLVKQVVDAKENSTS